ncbi:MAG TPA: aminomethyl-transferring glycine dehydrogenase subunit GcvPA [Planctomycetota bacterium]|nr:aminomethyl-transferring glycine dehydrogenase subunit GcvPA [Planctomycetota bacterium]
MAFIPHTDAERREMLAASGAASIDELFASIPRAFRRAKPLDLPPAVEETDLLRELEDLASWNKGAEGRACFLGGGMRRHLVPVAVDHLQSRSDFVTPYTPYQPEVSQGTLRWLYEYQTMICELTGLEVSNACVWEGQTAFVDGIRMAVAATERKRVVVSRGVHPHTRQALATITKHLGLEIVEAPLAADGRTDMAKVRALVDDRTAAVGLQSPNFLGVIEDGAAASEIAHAKGALAVGSFDPIALGLLASPGEMGFDVATGEGQPLGNFPCYGGPTFGFFAAKQAFLRQMPARIVGQTVDRDGKRGFVLTMTTREQHIRREKATSNICTSNTLMALRGAIYLALLGPVGLREVAEQCVEKSHAVAERIFAGKGLSPLVSAPFFCEFSVATSEPVEKVRQRLGGRDILGGIELRRWYPEFGNGLLFAVTEANTKRECDSLVSALGGAA